MEILNFIFQSFWHFIGCVVLLNVVLMHTVNLIRGYNYVECRDAIAELRGEIEVLKIGK